METPSVWPDHFRPGVHSAQEAETQGLEAEGMSHQGARMGVVGIWLASVFRDTARVGVGGWEPSRAS